MSRASRIETAIQAARQVAATPGARELHRREAKLGKNPPLGSWTAEDERRLRERGEIVTPGGVYRIKEAP